MGRRRSNTDDCEQRTRVCDSEKIFVRMARSIGSQETDFTIMQIEGGGEHRFVEQQIYSDAGITNEILGASSLNAYFLY